MIPVISIIIFKTSNLFFFSPGFPVRLAAEDGEGEAEAQPQTRQNKQNRPRTTTNSGKDSE